MIQPQFLVHNHPSGSYYQISMRPGFGESASSVARTLSGEELLRLLHKQHSQIEALSAELRLDRARVLLNSQEELYKIE